MVMCVVGALEGKGRKGGDAAGSKRVLREEAAAKGRNESRKATPCLTQRTCIRSKQSKARR
jgi:hypothetical protein